MRLLPVDQTTDYLILSGRDTDHVVDVKRFMSAQGLFYEQSSTTPQIHIESRIGPENCRTLTFRTKEASGQSLTVRNEISLESQPKC